MVTVCVCVCMCVCIFALILEARERGFKFHMFGYASFAMWVTDSGMQVFPTGFDDLAADLYIVQGRSNKLQGTYYTKSGIRNIFTKILIMERSIPFALQ